MGSTQIDLSKAQFDSSTFLLFFDQGLLNSGKVHNTCVIIVSSGPFFQVRPVLIPVPLFNFVGQALFELNENLLELDWDLLKSIQVRPSLMSSFLFYQALLDLNKSQLDSNTFVLFLDQVRPNLISLLFLVLFGQALFFK